MKARMDPRHLSRLDVQGFDSVDEGDLAQVARWLRLAMAVPSRLGYAAERSRSRRSAVVRFVLA